MDIVERLRQYRFKETHEAADEIERLREAMVEIMFLIGNIERRQEIMDIVKPWASQQIAFIDARHRAALKEK